MKTPGRVLLDTSIVIAHFRKESRIGQFLEETELAYLPVIALGELYHGAFKSKLTDRHLHQLDDFLLGVTLLDVDRDTALHYGRIRSELAKAGTPIPENDIWIAALASEYHMPLVTRDEHFSRIAGLTLVEW